MPEGLGSNYAEDFASAGPEILVSVTITLHGAVR